MVVPRKDQTFTHNHDPWLEVSVVSARGKVVKKGREEHAKIENTLVRFAHDTRRFPIARSNFLQRYFPTQKWNELIIFRERYTSKEDSLSDD